MEAGQRGRWTEKPTKAYSARELELFTETVTTLPVDFHSTRRAYATALVRANVNAQTAQVLAGHSDPKVHQRYVHAAIQALPEAATPALALVAAAQRGDAATLRRLAAAAAGDERGSPEAPRRGNRHAASRPSVTVTPLLCRRVLAYATARSSPRRSRRAGDDHSTVTVRALWPAPRH